jgi:hypothetical protein
MRHLVSALEQSAAGSSVLDLRLGRDLQNELTVEDEATRHGLMAEMSAETIKNIVGEMIVPFTRSLDAVLPGENIVFSMYSGEKSRWVAVQRNSDGQEYVSWAATEPLARRAAALRAIAGISTRRTDSAVVSLAEMDCSTEDVEADSGTSQPAWRVGF